MINNDRIVPITKIDRLSQIGEVLKLAGTSFTKLAALDVDGNFKATGTGDVGNILCDQPVKSFDFASGVTAGVAYFIAGKDYEGFKLAGVATDTAGADVDNDVATLYTATLSSSTVTIAKITP